MHQSRQKIFQLSRFDCNKVAILFARDPYYGNLNDSKPTESLTGLPPEVYAGSASHGQGPCCRHRLETGACIVRCVFMFEDEAARFDHASCRSPETPIALHRGSLFLNFSNFSNRLGLGTLEP